MDERDEPVREAPRVERETTIINTGGGGRSGGSGVVVAILVLLVLAVIAYVVFSGVLNRGGSDIDIKVKAPDIELPDVSPAKPASSQ
jgi:hypothetical protein